MSEDDIISPSKVIDIASRRPKKNGVGRKPKGRSTKEQARTFVQHCSEEMNQLPDRELTPEETRFVEAVRDGYSFSQCYIMAFPAIVDGLGVVPDEWDARLHQRGWQVARRPAVAASIGQTLDREGDLEIQNSKRLRNLVRKRLEFEACNAKSPAARLKALELLGKTEGVDAFVERTEEMSRAAPDEVMAEIKKLISKTA